MPPRQPVCRRSLKNACARALASIPARVKEGNPAHFEDVHEASKGFAPEESERPRDASANAKATEGPPELSASFASLPAALEGYLFNQIPATPKNPTHQTGTTAVYKHPKSNQQKC